MPSSAVQRRPNLSGGRPAPDGHTKEPGRPPDGQYIRWPSGGRPVDLIGRTADLIGWTAAGRPF